MKLRKRKNLIFVVVFQLNFNFFEFLISFYNYIKGNWGIRNKIVI